MREPDDPAAPGAGDAYATSAGPYVLGALSPADAQAFAHHLSGCAACRAAVQELAALPGLLSRVPAGALADPVQGAGAPVPDAGRVPDTLLPAMMRSVRAQRRRRRVAGSVAAGLVAASAVTAVAVSADRPPGATPQALPSPSPSPSATAPPGTGEPGSAGVLRPLLPTPLTITARLTGVDWAPRSTSRAPTRPRVRAPPTTTPSSSPTAPGPWSRSGPGRPCRATTRDCAR